MQIEPHIIDDILNKTDIVDLIGKSLKLKKQGGSYFACCPFHNEKTPSFSINPKEQFFHCFGCNESGDAITFIMRYYGYDFIEAVKYLGRDCGIDIEDSVKKLNFEEIKKQKEQKLTLKDTINKATKFYQDNLLINKTALQYFKNRGLSEEILQKFKLGFAPNNFTALTTIFKDYNNNQYLRSSGLVAKNSQNTIYDKFRNRVMFPIHNVRGEIIAFGGRVIDKTEPKYLNSPETELFNKSNELYGLYESQKTIRNLKFTIVVEGYMDVIALHQFDITNAVATMGTSITEEHIKKLFRMSDDIYFCFDGDSAGRKAAWRALERSIETVTELKLAHFVFLPQEHDPDSFIRTFGADKFLQEVKQSSLSLSEFLLTELSKQVNLQSNDGKSKLIGLIKPYIEKIKTPAFQVLLKKQLSDIIGLEPIVVESILNNRSRYAFYNSQTKNNHNLLTKSELPSLKINNIKLVIHNAVKNINWIHNYNLPDNIDNFVDEIQELALFLDYIAHNYNSEKQINLTEINNSIQFNKLNIKHIIDSKPLIQLEQQDFIDLLDNLFGIIKIKATRIPKISLKNK